MADAISVKYEDSRFGNLLLANGLGLATDYLSGYGNIFGNSELGRGMGTLFSSGVSSVGNTLSNNVLKGTALTEGLGKNAGASLAGAGVGLAALGIGKGINSLGGNSMLSRGIGQGAATYLGTVGGNAVGKLFGNASSINPYGLAASVVGSGLQAALGPSKEYGGKHGNITQTADTVYDAITVGVNAIPVWGLLASGMLTLNKGLSNLFGSTSGMTSTDAILGSAFMPAPVKWLNMAGAKTTGTFNNLSWLNSEKATSFMGNAFGNLLDKFDKAREEAGKTYGTFSRGAYNRALNNLSFANTAWGQIIDMADLNELQNIRSLYMTSINNLRYAQMIQGGWSPLARGKQGMKILNNATNHNIGMRLLSAAALIDNKQMILSALNGIKFKTTGGAGYTPPAININTKKIKEKLRKNLYNNLNPHSYLNLLDAVSAALGIKKTATDYVIENSENPINNLDFETSIDDAIWATYLNIPENQRRKNSKKLRKSKYEPSIGKENTTYYEFPILDYDSLIRLGLSEVPINNNKVFDMDYGFRAPNVGDFTIGHGYDNKGDYISAYDKWDINPFKGKYRKTGLIGNIGNKLFGKKGDLSFGIGRPVNLYSRIYLDDYYKIPNPYRGGIYLPEVVVYPSSNNKSK